MRAPSTVTQRSSGVWNAAGCAPSLRIVESTLRGESHSRRAQEIAGEHGLQIDADRWSSSELEKSPRDRESMPLNHLILGRYRERDAKINEPPQQIVGKIVAMDNVDVRPDQTAFDQLLPAPRRLHGSPALVH
jgi:hypothetical protein